MSVFRSEGSTQLVHYGNKRDAIEEMAKRITYFWKEPKDIHDYCDAAKKRGSYTITLNTQMHPMVVALGYELCNKFGVDHREWVHWMMDTVMEETAVCTLFRFRSRFRMNEAERRFGKLIKLVNSRQFAFAVDPSINANVKGENATPPRVIDKHLVCDEPADDIPDSDWAIVINNLKNIGKGKLSWQQ